MAVFKLPQNLAAQLGVQGSAELIQVLNETAANNRDKTVELMELRFEKKLESEINGVERRLDNRITEEAARLDNRISKLDNRLTQESARLDNRITEEAAKLYRRMDEGFLGIQKQFTVIQGQFTEMQKQITTQTKWVVGMIGFIAAAMKALDLFVK